MKIYPNIGHKAIWFEYNQILDGVQKGWIHFRYRNGTISRLSNVPINQAFKIIKHFRRIGEILHSGGGWGHNFQFLERPFNIDNWSQLE